MTPIEYRSKKEELIPTAKKIADDLAKKDLTIIEAEIIVELLSKMVKPDIQDNKLSDFI